MSRLFAVALVAGVHGVSADLLTAEKLRRQCGTQTLTAALEDMSLDTRARLEKALGDACTGKAGNELVDCRIAYHIKTYGNPNYVKCEDAFKTEPTEACLEIALAGMEEERIDTTGFMRSPLIESATYNLLVQWFIGPPASGALASNARDVFRTCQILYGGNTEYCSPKNAVGTTSPEFAACTGILGRNLKEVEVYGPPKVGDTTVLTHLSAVVFKYVEGQDKTYGDTTATPLTKKVLKIPAGVFVKVAEATVNPASKKLCKLKIQTTDDLPAQEVTADSACLQGPGTTFTSTKFYSRAPNDFKVDSKGVEPVYPTGFSYGSVIPKDVCQARVTSGARIAMSDVDKAAITSCQALFHPGAGEGCFGLGTSLNTLQLQEVMVKCKDAPCKAFVALHSLPPSLAARATADSKLQKCQVLFEQYAACALAQIQNELPAADYTEIDAAIIAQCVPAADTCRSRAWSYNFFRLTETQQNTVLKQCLPQPR